MCSLMKKLLATVLLVLLLPCSVLANFSSSQVLPHPTYPGTEPFIIEINGIWPTARARDRDVARLASWCRAG